MTTRSSGGIALVGSLLVAAGCSNQDNAGSSSLQDPDPQVRRTAIRTLAASDQASTGALTALHTALDDQDESVRVTAALELMKSEPANSQVQGILTSALRAGQGPVFIAISESGSAVEWAAPTLVALLADQRAPIRALAAQTLGKTGIRNDRVISALRRGLRDENAAVRRACQRALD